MHLLLQSKMYFYSDIKFCRYDCRYLKIRFKFPWMSHFSDLHFMSWFFILAFCIVYDLTMSSEIEKVRKKVLNWHFFKILQQNLFQQPVLKIFTITKNAFRDHLLDFFNFKHIALRRHPCLWRKGYDWYYVANIHIVRRVQITRWREITFYLFFIILWAWIVLLV